jgi:hypothetical protein
MFNRRSFLRAPIYQNKGEAILEDTFTAADNTSLDAHTIAPINRPATAWTERNGDWKIVGNEAKLAVGLQAAIATCDPGIADCILECSVKNDNTKTGSTYDDGIVARYADASHLWQISISKSGNAFRIVETDTTVTTRASAVISITATYYTIKATLAGQSITATLDGANPLSYASAALNQTVTVHGIRGYATTDAIDSFKVTP